MYYKGELNKPNGCFIISEVGQIDLWLAARPFFKMYTRTKIFTRWIIFRVVDGRRRWFGHFPIRIAGIHVCFKNMNAGTSTDTGSG